MALLRLIMTTMKVKNYRISTNDTIYAATASEKVFKKSIEENFVTMSK